MTPLERMQTLCDQLGIGGGEAAQIINLLDELLDQYDA